MAGSARNPDAARPNHLWTRMRRLAYVGGLAGYVRNVDLTKSYVTGTVNGLYDIDEVFTNVTVNPTMPASGAVYAGGLPDCQTGTPSSELKAPHADPDKLLVPYIIGQYVDQSLVDAGAEACKLKSGSDGDWGNTDPFVPEIIKRVVIFSLRCGIPVHKEPSAQIRFGLGALPFEKLGMRICRGFPI